MFQNNATIMALLKEYQSHIINICPEIKHYDFNINFVMVLIPEHSQQGQCRTSHNVIYKLY